MEDKESEEIRKKYPTLNFFKYAHLPDVLQKFSKPFGDLAETMARELKDSPHFAEVAAGLRKLVEAKDCFVRARLPANGEPIKK
jgi:hypothetical protein